MPKPTLPDGKVPTGKTTAAGKPGTRRANWWDHTGPLAVVFAGGPEGKRGDLVLPVRIPQGAGQWERVQHFLGNPGRWHKIDLVRRRKASAPGGWAYEAHLMVLGPGYTAPDVRAMREQAAELERIGGVDGNVSNLSVVSFPADLTGGKPVSTEITLTEEERARLEKAAKKRRGRARALERSRRATNTAQYGLSKKQARRAERRTTKGLAPKAVTVPGGARDARSDGVPKQAFRRDQLSANYRTQRARQAEHAASLAEHRRHRARQVAREIIAAHGPVLVVEDCDIRTWYRLWGKRLSQTTPGMLISALKVECEAAGGRLVRASTWSTALSQYCLCGERVKKTLRDREHKCIACGLVGKRDLVSAALAAFVRFTDVDDPKTAYLDTTLSRHAQITYSEALEEALRESTTPSPKPPRRPGRVAVPRQRRGTSAPRTAGQRNRATPDETRLVRDHAGKPGPRTACSPQLTLW
ncbi:zinc ribbon domain-containing protein [Streptomyces sp. APSN-46.1]|uniref:zinc ribbon domain-containing protein n=1 Tax=Streptomyces sp. APSN-46.1 TaxID=2929049 RepID=UPI001FB4393E|nr:zinc ribbon domain-containing protein [Streptomyces sp. APSN-46.1]MCJ1677810.1 zinc ribbon domain-containing protein [Streptomyces sp. APSN-46.1]